MSTCIGKDVANMWVGIVYYALDHCQSMPTQPLLKRGSLNSANSEASGNVQVGPSNQIKSIKTIDRLMCLCIYIEAYE